tara:strand:+ start:251 stop:1501 length:1251 start_codon:yes stop_codon:yes gene_type:complete
VAKKKKKVLVLADHALSTSGVGCQTRHLLQGLIEKGEWSFRQFGAALKHANYDTVVVNEDLIIKPIDGFGNPDLIRVALATEKPDAVFIFTDPRFFIWLFEMEDEIHQMCPIVWWHVWDNRPTPLFNYTLYESTDLINCHSYLTYEMCCEAFEEKTNFIPHAVPKDMFFQMEEEGIHENRISILGEGREDDFVGIWVNRNAKRKRPSDLLEGWQIFLDNLEKKHGHRKASLIMHTEPLDPEGPNLFMVAERLGIQDSILFSRDRLDFDKMNVLYNVADFCINCSYAEGFGLSTLEAMQTGTPIIAVKTGGLTRQVVDHRDNSENGVAIDVDLKTMVGSQSVPYIYEDYATAQSIASALMEMYEKSPEEKVTLSKKVKDYVASEFNMQKTVDMWHETMSDCIENWEDRHQRWECITI